VYQGMCRHDVKVYNVLTVLLISTGHGNNSNCGIKVELHRYAIGVPRHRISRFT